MKLCGKYLALGGSETCQLKRGHKGKHEHVSKEGLRSRWTVSRHRSTHVLKDWVEPK